jgi:hypothetical protein
VLFSAKTRQEGLEPNLSLGSASIRAQLERIMASGLFRHSRRYPSLLRHVVERTLDGAVDELKERTLGVAVFKRHPEYDTSADPVVRTTASEIRKRLDEYYSDPSHACELRIALPVGTYVPEFRLPDTDGPPLSASDSIRMSRSRHWRIWALAGLFLMAVGLAVTIRTYSAGNALHRFWEPVLNTSPVLVVEETLMGVPKQSTTQHSGAVEEILDPKLLLLLSETNSKMAAYFSVNRRTLEYELARNVTISKLRTRPFILKGAFNNPLSWQAVSSFRYFLNLDRASLVRQIVDRQDPSRHWDSPMAALSRDYALIARAPEPRTGQTMVVIAGLGERGNAAATEFLTNPKYMERFAAQSPRGWEHRNLEIVLKTELLNDDWGEPHIIATHIW